MDEFSIEDSWNYFRSLSDDMTQTSRYVEPKGQDSVFSIEFAKIIILSCIELESVFKAICAAIDGNKYGNIGEYKAVILAHYPKITEALVNIPRSREKIKPFADWDKGPLFWWDAYQEVKHTRGRAFGQASYRNAVYSLSALYIAILYYAEIKRCDLDSVNNGGYVSSRYISVPMVTEKLKELPDFERRMENSQ